MSSIVVSRSFWFVIVEDGHGGLTTADCIAVGRSLRNRRRLRKKHSGSRWRKIKGVAVVGLPNGVRALAEIPWDEAHGVGRVDFKAKRLLEVR
jgi:hypothetical protein